MINPTRAGHHPVVRWCAFLLLAAGAAAFSGCTVDVLFGFKACEQGGVEHAAGAIYTDTDGCQCTCGTDGACVNRTCAGTGGGGEGGGGGCDYEGNVLAANDMVVSPDGCLTCTCMPDGTVVCVDRPCGPCAEAPPFCEQPLSPYCVAEAVCDLNGWVCVETCECETGMPPNCAAPPTGCYWSGPYCDEDGAWTCGDLICDGCQSAPDMCPDPMMPGCWTEPWCDGFNWECIVVCDACMMDPVPPECFATQQDCMAYPYCDPIYGWQCAEDCAMPGCVGAPPLCDSMDPQCFGQPVCVQGDWYCEFACVE